MPWVRSALCVGCGVCVEACPADAIEMTDERRAVIDEESCIRCGRCHEVCPEQAVRHDGERIPDDVIANLRWVRALLGRHGTAEEKAAFMERITRYFGKEKQVNERTIVALQACVGDPADELEATVQRLSKDVAR